MQNNQHSTDEELLQRIKRADSSALKILFERYFSALCRFASTVVKTTDTAEEVVSDVFLALWLRKDTIEIRTNLKTYLYTAIRNQSLNYVKKNKIHAEGIETAVKENKTSELTADKALIYEELKDDIDALLRQLPEKRRIIFTMNRIDGLRYKEIAEILSISVHTVQNQMVAAVKFLTHQHPRHK